MSTRHLHTSHIGNTHPCTRIILALCALLIMSTAVLPMDASAELVGVQFRGFSGQFQQLLDLNSDGSVTTEGPVFELQGGVFGLGSIGSTLYGTELDPNNVDWFLVTIPHTGLALGERVGVSPIGFPNVEGLAYCAHTDTLYGSSFDFDTHLTTLIEINPTTGVGSSIGTMSFNVFMVGLACDPDGTLYGIAKAFGVGTAGLPPTLYTIDETTGEEIPIGELGLATIPPGHGPLEGLAWDNGKLIAGFENLYDIDTTIGAASLIGGDYTTTSPGDGVYGLTSIASDFDDTGGDGPGSADSGDDGSQGEGDESNITWEAVSMIVDLVVCKNKTTGQKARVDVDVPRSGSCGDLGLVWDSGDNIQIKVVGTITSTHDAGGSGAGITPTLLVCKNRSARPLDKARVENPIAPWICFNEGLPLTVGDQLQWKAKGLAN